MLNIAHSDHRTVAINVQSFLELFEFGNYGQILCADDNILFSADIENNHFSQKIVFYVFRRYLYTS